MDRITDPMGLGGVHNVRDLGGLPLAQGGTTRRGRVFRGDALQGVDTDGLRHFLSLGLDRILDFRSDAEVELAPNPLAHHEAVRYRHMPLYDGLATIQSMAEAHPGGFDMGLRYRAALVDCAPAVARALRAVAEAGEEAGGDTGGATLFHCTAGKDRTGIIAALLLLNAGVPREAVVADYALTGTRGAGLIAVLRQKMHDRGTEPGLAARVLASEAATMAATLDWLEAEQGGVAGYLSGIGLSEAERAALRDRLAA